VTYAALPVTVAHPGHVLQSLDGQLSARIRWIDNGDPRELDLRSTTFAVPGRARPPVRFAAAGDGGGELVMETVGSETANMHALLASGRPLVLRTDGPVPFMPAVELVLPVRGSHRIYGADTRYGDTRRWTVPYLLVDDPEPGTALAAFTWDDFDEAMTGRTWSAMLTRTNRATRPRPSQNATGWGFQNGTGEATAITSPSTPAAGPEGRTGFRRATISAAKTTGSSGHYYRESGLAGAAGDARAFGMWARFSHAVNTALAVQYRTGSTVTGGTFGGVTALVPADTWVYLTTQGAATGTYDTIQVWATVSGGTVIPAGGWYDATDALIEDGLVPGAYFDGSFVDTSSVDYSWTGAAFASTSTATGPDPASFDGLFAASVWDAFDVFDWDQL
jgi:hypothetical protein